MDWKTLLSAGLFVGAITLVVLASTATGATLDAQQNNSSYHTTRPAVENVSWYSGNEDPTLDAVVLMLTRVGTFVVSGGASPAVGAVVTGLLAFAGVVSVVGDSTVGVVGGAVVGVATIAGLATAGLVAQWVWALVALAVGLVLATVIFRALK